MGYDGLWVLDRLLAPVEPRSWYGGIEGVPLPPEQERALDPFVVLATAAGDLSSYSASTCGVHPPG